MLAIEHEDGILVSSGICEDLARKGWSVSAGILSLSKLTLIGVYIRLISFNKSSTRHRRDIPVNNPRGMQLFSRILSSNLL